MRVHADHVSIEGPHGTVLAPTSLTVADGEARLVHGEPGAGITAFGLTLTGRFRPTTGVVTLDGESGAAKLRAASAIVDAPGVSEPDGALALRVVVGEELALGGRPGRKRDAENWLTEHDAAAFAGVRFENLEPPMRTRLLAELAAGRRGVKMLVLDTPDRHTSDVGSWAGLADELAARGLAVVVLTATTPVEALPHAPALIGETP